MGSEIERVLYAGCALTFAGLLALVAGRHRQGRIGALLIFCCAATIAWAGCMAWTGLLSAAGRGVIDTVRLSGWLVLAVTLAATREGGGRARLPIAAAAAFSLLALAVAVIGLVPAGGPVATGRLPAFFKLGFGITGLLAIENLWRNTEEPARPQLWPLCLALGSMFAFELFLYADGLLIRGASATLGTGRAVVGILAAPLLAVAMARNRAWRVDIHVSRGAVLHTAALVVSGALFLALAVLAEIVRQLGGGWGPVLQLITLLGSAVVLISVLGWRDLRLQAKRFISHNFYSHRYDYRAEWLRFLDTVAQQPSATAPLFERVIRALAQLVDSPAGSLWCLRPGIGYVCETAWNAPRTRGESVAIDDPFIGQFRDGSWVQEQIESGPGSWPEPVAAAWLAVPLTHAGQMTAFALLMPPRWLEALNWESFDLLRAAGRQAASYIAEERATRALLDAEQVTEFSKRFAFVVHDVKNLANQLGLVVANARRHGDDPEFRQDMLQTIERSVARLNRLLARLRSGVEPLTAPTEPDRIVAEVMREMEAAGTAVESRLEASGRKIRLEADRLRSILYHLISNASEASGGDGVLVASRGTRDRVTIDVVDRGPGMDEAFVRQNLFKPFRSSKADGLGIGAYQAREMLRAAGGDLEVISEPGVGTTMRILLPAHEEAVTPAPTA